MVDIKSDPTIIDDEIRGIADRLRGSRDEADNREFEVGDEYGEAWASDFAEWYELVSLLTDSDDLGEEGHPGIETYLANFDDIGTYRTEWGVAVSTSFKAGFLAGANRIYQKVWPLMDD